MKPKKNTEQLLKIDNLAFGGEGVGSLDGFKIFVPNVAPGDTVKVRLGKIKSRYAEGKLVEVVDPSPKRIQPRCKHFDTCGGCVWQFLSYEEQLKVKEQQVRDSVERLANLDGALVQPILPSEDPWFYRNKMEFSFGPGAENSAMLGFYPPGYHFEVFDLEECFLQADWTAEIVKKVRDFVNEHKIPIYHSDTHEGLLKNLIVREGKNTGEIMLILVTSTGVFEHRDAFVELFKNDPRITSIYWTTVYQVPGQPTWREGQLLWGKPTLSEILRLENGQELRFEILPDAFFQTNTHQAERLYSETLKCADIQEQEVVYDLYCGTGTLGLFCAHKAKAVYGIEVNEAAVESARENAQLNKIGNASFFLGSVEERLKSLTEKPDVILVDPPRAGLGERVIEDCVAFGAKRIVYVSCNPTTLARDLKFFAQQNYQTKLVQPVDMFPQTHHIECVTLLEKML